MNDVVKRSNSIDTFLSILSLTRDGYLDETANMLMSLPLLDTSTGVSYRNTSTYVCNRASLSHATPWDIFLPVEHYDSLYWSDMRTVKDIFRLINVTNARYPYTHTSKSENEILNENFVQCRPDVVASCRDNFTDEDVIQACNDVTFIIKAFLKSGGDDDDNSEVEITYKNPFCLYCSLESLDKLVPGKSKLDIKLAKELRSGLELSFNPSSNQSDFRILNKLTGKVEAPSWESLSCNFSVSMPIRHDSDVMLRHNDVMLNATRETGRIITQGRNSKRVLVGNDDSISNGSHIVRSECRIDRCKYNKKPSVGRCAQTWNFLLMLPPTRHPLSHDYLTCVLEAWKAVLFNFSYPDVWIEPPGQELVRQFNQVREVGGLQYAYALHFTLKSGIYGFYSSNEFWTSDQKKQFVALMKDVRYPFQSDKNYFCAANKMKKSAIDDYWSCRGHEKHVMSVPLSTNTNYDDVRAARNMTSCYPSVPSLNYSTVSIPNLNAKPEPSVAIVFIVSFLSLTLFLFEG